MKYAQVAQATMNLGSNEANRGHLLLTGLMTNKLILIKHYWFL